MPVGDKTCNVLHLVGGGAFFGESLPIGGAAQYVSLLLQGLDKETYRSSLAFFHEGPTPAAFRAQGYPVHVLPKKFPKDPTLIPRLVRLLRREHIDLIHTHVTNADFFGRIAGRLCGIKVVTTIHSFIWGTMAGVREKPWRERVHWWQQVHLSCLNHGIAAVSGPLERELIRQGVNPGKLAVIPPGLDPQPVGSDGAAFREELGVGPDVRLIGTSGRLSPVKNLGAFLEVAGRLAARHADVRFVIMGDGPQRGNLEQEAAQRGLGDRVLFPGWRDDIAACLPALDLFLVTSHCESFCLALLEAMACGVPVVAPEVGGIPDVLEHGDGGYLYAPGDVAAATALLDRLLLDSESRTAMGARAAELARDRFSLQAMADKTNNLYQAVLGTQAGGEA